MKVSPNIQITKLKKFTYPLFLSILLLLSCSFMHKDPEVVILTNYGKIVIKLYNETPLHRDNFVKLVKDSFYKDLLFHRVIKGFVIQGGDPDSKNAKPGDLLGEGDLHYTIPAEFNTKLYHKRGVLAAARESDDVNPLKRSSSTQFYIVQGKTFTSEELDQIEEKKNKEKFIKKLDADPLKEYNSTSNANILKKGKAFQFTKKQRKIYMKKGGAPRLDMNYTVFGEVKEGMEVVDKIANLQTDKNDRPLEDIRFTIIMKN